jgi:hypothetical protein
MTAKVVASAIERAIAPAAYMSEFRRFGTNVFSLNVDKKLSAVRFLTLSGRPAEMLAKKSQETGRTVKKSKQHTARAMTTTRVVGMPTETLGES